MYNQTIPEEVRPVLKDRQLTALNIEFQVVATSGLWDVIQATGGDGPTLNDRTPFRETMKVGQHLGVRLEQRGHSRTSADLQCARVPITDRCLNQPCAGQSLGLKRCELLFIWLKGNKVHLVGRTQGLVRGLTIDWAGTNVHHTHIGDGGQQGGEGHQHAVSFRRNRQPLTVE
jgi:hypothetical protein